MDSSNIFGDCFSLGRKLFLGGEGGSEYVVFLGLVMKIFCLVYFRG